MPRLCIYPSPSLAFISLERAPFIWLIIAYSIIQILDGNLLAPILMSGATSLHPIAVIVAILIFGGLWGFWGVFFAIPLATLINSIIKAWPMEPAPPSSS